MLPGGRRASWNKIVWDEDGAEIIFRSGNEVAGGCPYGHFCLYEHANFGGTQLNLYYCGVYELRNYSIGVNRVSSVVNNQTPGTWAQLWDREVFQRDDLNYSAPAYHDLWYLGAVNDKADYAIPCR
jgi:hypothetical protein